MIIRKPYALLIKNFKLIHFIMLLFSIFVLYRTSIALDFFNEYVSSRQFIESETLINDTIPLSITVFSVLLVFFASAIVVLFNKKDKPTLFYVANIIYYLIFVIICFVSRSIISTIMFDGIDPRISRIVRDIWLISLILQVIVVGFYLIRALGFDVKKFNFGEDLHQLKIEAEDDEEVEITTAFDTEKIRMRAAMQKEELKSFFYENKFIIITILFLLIVVIPTTLIARNIIANKKYVIGEVINLDGLNFKIIDSYITKKDYKGNTLFKNDTSYLIVKFSIENLLEKERGVVLDYLRIEVNDKIYTPKTTYYDYFNDLGKGYNGQKILKEKKEYIAVYVINDEDLNYETIVRYADKIKVKNNEAQALYYRIIIKPKNLDENIEKINGEIKQDLVIDSKIKLNISHYNIKDKFLYEIDDKTKYIINTNGLVLSLSYNFTNEKDQTMAFKELLEKYGVIKYTINNLSYTQKIENITPNNYNLNDIFLAVNENIQDSSAIELVFKMRDKEYIYKIK